MKYKTQWDMTLFYASAKDPQIEVDLQSFEKAHSAFARAYKGKQDYMTSESALLEAMKDWEELMNIAGTSKPILYFHFLKDLKGSDAFAQSQINILTGRLNKIVNETLFFPVSLAKIDKNLQTVFLDSEQLAPYRYFLKTIFDQSAHVLSEAEEKILTLMQQPAVSMWVNGQEKLLNEQTVKWEKKEIPLSQASNLLVALPTKKRRVLSNLILEKLKSVSHFAEQELNAVYTHKKIGDELRGYKEPYSATVLQFQNDEHVVSSLVETVSDNFPISHKFYRLKARFLGEKVLSYADRGASIGKNNKTISFDEAVQIVQKAFRKVDPKFEKILNNFLAKGQIDAFPRKGKASGAYCASATGIPTLVLLNHSDTSDSVMVFGHEMGHAFHSEFSESQPILYQNYATSVAEVASTLFENFVFEELLETMSVKEKVIALHDRINDDISTIFRQIAAFNFEKALHYAIREKGSLSAKEIATLMNIHMKAYLGPQFQLNEVDGYLFVSWSHIRHFFYVYSYAYGQLISKALYARYKKDPAYLSQIESFLSAGGSASPEQIFKSIGIDVADPSFFQDGLRSISDDIERLERLANEAGLFPKSGIVSRKRK